MSDSSETWRDVPGFPGYQVSDAGRVRSARKILRPSRRKVDGRLVVSLGRGTKERVHRLVLLAFRGPCPDGLEACHENDDPTDNRLTNLRWDTSKANKADARRNGRLAVERRRWNCKLSDAQVEAVRERLTAKEPHGVIAAAFGVSRSLVTKIATGAKRSQAKANAAN